MYHMLFEQHSWSIIFISWTGNSMNGGEDKSIFSSDCQECSY